MHTFRRVVAITPNGAWRLCKVATMANMAKVERGRDVEHGATRDEPLPSARPSVQTRTIGTAAMGSDRLDSVSGEGMSS